MKYLILLTNLLLINALSIAQDTNIVYSKDVYSAKRLGSMKKASYIRTTIKIDQTRIVEVTKVEISLILDYVTQKHHYQNTRIRVRVVRK